MPVFPVNFWIHTDSSSCQIFCKKLSVIPDSVLELSNNKKLIYLTILSTKWILCSVFNGVKSHRSLKLRLPEFLFHLTLLCTHRLLCCLPQSANGMANRIKMIYVLCEKQRQKNEKNLKWGWFFVNSYNFFYISPRKRQEILNK